MTATFDAIAVLSESRALMDRSAAQARRGISRKEIVERLMAATPPVPLALPAPARVTMASEPVAKVIDLTSVAPFTERALATATGISLAQIAKAISAKKITVTKRKGQPRLLGVASTARWLQHAHGMDPTVLLDINQED
jgi:hypothetical protein